MKIVFVQPRVGYEGCSYWDALGIGYIISYLKSKGFNGEIKFYSGAFDPDDVIVKACSEADFVGFGCTSPQLKNALLLSRRIKEVNPDCKTVFGGWHATADPLGTIKHQEVDYVITGEGEIGMHQLISGYTKEPVINSPCFPNLDKLPWPDRDTIKVERHIQVAYKENGERITSIEGSRGCPFSCVFCSEILKTKNWVRRRSPSKLVDEIEYVVDKYRIDFLKFVDTEINTSLKWLENLCQELISRSVDVELGANFHAAIANKEIFQLMKRSGFREIWIGVESGSPRILRSINKGVTVDQIKRVFRWSREARLFRRAYFLIGIPEEKTEDVKLTFKLAEEIKADQYGMTILMPFPGTPIYNEYRDQIQGWDLSKCDEYGNPYWKTEHFTNEQLKEIQQRFVKAFKDKLCYRLKGAES